MGAGDSTTQVTEIMVVQETGYQYREWQAAVPGMRHAVGKQVVWKVPHINLCSEEWVMARPSDTDQLTHRLLMGERKGFGRKRWCCKIQGAYQSIRSVEYSKPDCQ